MFCVNPENGYLAVKALASDGTCQFTSLYTVQELAARSDQITPTVTASLIAAAAGLYGLVFVIRLILQQLGYRSS